MDLQTRKLHFIEEFLKLQSEEVIARLEKILRKESAYVQNPMSKNELEQRITASLADSEQGNVISADDLLKKIEKWA